MNAAAFTLDVDSSPTQLSRRRAHLREISRVRAVAIGLTIALAFTSGLGAALAVQLARTGGATTLRERHPRTVVVRGSALRVLDGADEKHVAPAVDEKTPRAARKSLRGRRAPAPPAPAAAVAATEESSEVVPPGELLDRGIVTGSPPDPAP